MKVSTTLSILQNLDPLKMIDSFGPPIPFSMDSLPAKIRGLTPMGKTFTSWLEPFIITKQVGSSHAVSIAPTI
jgi:hypothetical protein